MKRLLAFLTLITVSFTALANTPTDIQVVEAWESNQGAIVAMVQKLYVLEHAEPVLSIPELMIIETTDNTVVVDYADKMTIEIGVAPDNLLYSIDLEPKDVTIASVAIDQTLPIWIKVVISVALFLGGVVTGTLSAR